ncbi:MAG: hypothetical protein AB7F40_04630 [Victivallaceae bacterium]|nr:hypothetical protein [Victivallaceae bacterium]
MSENRKLSREDIAKMEIGRTEVSAPLKWTFALFFIVFITLYPVVQMVHDIRSGAPGVTAIVPEIASVRAGTPLEYASELTAGLKRFERGLEDASLLRAWLLPPVQEFLTRYLRTGNEKVIVGHDGWLFYAPDFQYVAHPGFLRPEVMRKRAEKDGVQPDPVAAIVDFKEQLEKRGITLIVVPMPVKPTICGRYLGGGEGVLENPSFPEFMRRLKENGVKVVELAGALSPESYLKLDTHLTPDGVSAVGTMIDGRPSDAAVASEQVTNCGDIAAMLKLPDVSKVFAPQTVTLTQKADAFSRDSEYLLLGDSFTNIYSASAMGWGEHAGLGERLAGRVGQIDMIARNDCGSYATRAMLATELKRGRDRLAGKKYVIWEFAERELAFGDWKMIDLAPGTPPEDKFVLPEPGSPLEVTGTVLAMTAAPRPGQSAYSDHLMAVHLGDIDGGDAQALCYLVDLKNNVPGGAAALRPGDTVKLRLRNFSDRPEYESWSRSDLADESLLLQEPCFGEIEADKI